MLVFVTGSEAVGRPLIAKKISEKLNSFDQYQIGSYKVDFTSASGCDIFDADGNLVYQPATDSSPGINSLLINASDGSSNADGRAIFDQAQAVSGSILSTVRPMWNEFSAVEVDVGLTTLDSITNIDFESIVNAYQSKTNEYMVAHGLVSKSVIEKISGLIGESVMVLNVTRNPSAAFLLDPKISGQGKNASKTKNAVINDVPYASKQLIISIITSALLIPASYVTTVKYEDIITSGQISFNGTTIPLNEYQDFNGIISKYDSEQIIPTLDSNRIASLTQFNTTFTSINSYSVPVSTTVQNNQFDALGYSPLTYDTIVRPKS
jgi:hypothetical protein